MKLFPHYAVSSSLQPLPPPYVQTFFSVPCSPSPTTCVTFHKKVAGYFTVNS